VVDLIDAVEADEHVEPPPTSRRSRFVRSGPEDPDPRGWRRYLPLLLVAFAVGFSAWMLRAELHVIPYPNDASTHASFMRFAEQRIRAGHSPFDAWYPYLGLGTPEFLQYQSLSHIITAVLSIALGGWVFRGLSYGLICTWPITVYIGARLMGLNRWEAATAALFSPMLSNVVGYGFEWASFVWLGSGMWSMLFAIWLMPVALGLAWRAVAKGERYALAVFVVGLTCAFHFITGYLVLLAIGVFVILRPPQVLKRLGRGALVGCGALLTFAFVFVPTLAGLNYVNVNSFQVGTFWDDSYGPVKVFTWLFHGELFDYGRFPVISLFVAVGTLVCLVRSRRSEAARVPLGLMVLSLAMYSGRHVVGPVLDRLPGGSDLLLHRYIIGVHFAGMLLAAVGAVWAFRLVVGAGRYLPKVGGRNVIGVVVACALAAVVIWPVLNNRNNYAKANNAFIAQQLVVDKTELRDVNALIDIAKARGGGRIYAGTTNNWGAQIKVGQVDFFELPLQRDADSIGFTLRTDSLSSDIETYFNEFNPAQYDLFDVKYILLPPGRQPGVTATELKNIDGYSLWQVNTSGYLEVIDTTDPMIANDKDMLKVFGPYLAWPAVQELRHPLVAFDGKSTPPPTTTIDAPFTGVPGSVISSSESLDNGEFSGVVQANRPAYVMLKESYYPHWKATVNGVSVKPVMVAPSFVAVPVPTGTSTVVFQYHSQSGYPLFFAIGMVTLLGFALGPWLWRKYRRRKAPADDPAVAEVPEAADA
jgi:hypothetical protein